MGLHTFAANLFHDGVKDALAWVFVDYTPGIPRNATVADELRLGARPYWVKVAASDMLDVKTAAIDGREHFIHARWRECSVERDGWGEREIERVRVLNRAPIEVDGRVTGYAPATWTLWELQESETTKRKEWVIVDSGEITIGVIPLVPFTTGRRYGSSWRIEPPMRAAAELQIELYQKEGSFEVLASLGLLSDAFGKRREAGC